MQSSISSLAKRMNRGLVAIVGTTGVGKSDLAVQLAKALNGEVINADAMQVKNARHAALLTIREP